MYAHGINDQLSRYTAKVLKSYLKFPEGKSITALDPKCEDGQVLYELTKSHELSYRFGAEPHMGDSIAAGRIFHKVSRANYMEAQAKITNDVFSLAIVNPTIHDKFMDEIFSDFDTFKVPDFEAEAQTWIEQQKALREQYASDIDFGDEGLTEEDIQKRQENMQKQIEKRIDDQKLAFRRALREQEKRFEFYRRDKYSLAFVTKYLAPGGILIFVTPKEFIDSQVAMKFTNNYEDIRVYRLDDDEYMDQRKCIIIAKKRMRPIRDDRHYISLMNTKLKPYKEIPVLQPQTEPLYELPSKLASEVQYFRVGNITPEEALMAISKSNVIDTYRATYSQTFDDVKPMPPTTLHKGHVSLLLASGLLNGYIGTGPDQHLVKGSVHKLSSEIEEEETADDGSIEIKIKEREYFSIGIKYLDRHGQFHKLL